MLQKGSTGEYVRKIQLELGIKADGIFGPETEQAVKDFQLKNNLKVDGIVGPLTAQKMSASIMMALRGLWGNLITPRG